MRRCNSRRGGSFARGGEAPRPHFAATRTRGGCIGRRSLHLAVARVGENDLSRKRQFAILPRWRTDCPLGPSHPRVQAKSLKIREKAEGFRSQCFRGLPQWTALAIRPRVCALWTNRRRDETAFCYMPQDKTSLVTYANRPDNQGVVVLRVQAEASKLTTGKRSVARCTGAFGRTPDGTG